MALSPELQTLQDEQYDYHANPNASDKIKDKVLTMLIAPTKVGKSSVIEEVLKSELYWREVGTTTTRKHRDNDPENYVTDVTLERIKEYIESGNIINYTVFDTGDIYGTMPSGFPADVNLLPTQFRSVKTLREAGFKRTESIFLVTDASDWKDALKSSDMKASELADRLDEGIASLEFALANAEEPWLHLVENSRRTAGLHMAAQKVIAITNRLYEDEHRAKRLAQAEAMLYVAKAYRKTLQAD